MSQILIPSSFPFASGEILQGFRLEVCVGSGGMGMAWKATQIALDRVVCVKFLHPDHRVHPGYLRLLQAEAKTLATLDHPNILTIHHLGEVEGHFFIVTEFVDGVSLQECISNWILTPEEKLEVIRATGSAVQFVHDRGVLHRDLKPGNILVNRWGRIKVADFGLSKMLAAPGDMTSTGHLGTESYAAPEILLGRNYDHRADQFSLAVTFYRLMTGFFPPIPGTVNPNKPLAPAVEEVFARALSIEAESRFPSVSDFCIELMSELTGGERRLVLLDQVQIPIRSGLNAETPGMTRPSAADPRDAPTAAPPSANQRDSGMIRIDESWMPIPKAIESQRPPAMPRLVGIGIPATPTPLPPIPDPEPVSTPTPPIPTLLPTPKEPTGTLWMLAAVFLLGVVLTALLVYLSYKIEQIQGSPVESSGMQDSSSPR